MANRISVVDGRRDTIRITRPYAEHHGRGAVGAFG
jgi:hypothetical protein